MDLRHYMFRRAKLRLVIGKPRRRSQPQRDNNDNNNNNNNDHHSNNNTTINNNNSNSDSDTTTTDDVTRNPPNYDEDIHNLIQLTDDDDLEPWKDFIQSATRAADKLTWIASTSSSGQ